MRPTSKMNDHNVNVPQFKRRLARHLVSLPLAPWPAILCVVAIALIWNVVTVVWGSTVIVGDHSLLPDTPNQTVAIQVQGGEPVSGIDLFVQVGDGGPELSALGLPSGHRGPRITHVELMQGTIFDGLNDTPVDIGAPELRQTAIYTLALIGAIPSVPAAGTLVKLTVDTTDLYHGDWDLLLRDVLPYPELSGPYATNFAGVPADIGNGKLSIQVSIGDFDRNGLIDARDIDRLSAAIRQGSNDLVLYDVTGDGAVNLMDHGFWVNTIARTFFGDANLDGEFGSSDLVAVFQAGQYEDSRLLNSTWSSGDWDGDAEFTSGDLVAAFQQGGYEIGPRPALAAVPEPTTVVLLLAGLFVARPVYRRQRFVDRG